MKYPSISQILYNCNFFTYGAEGTKFEAITHRDMRIDKVLGLQSAVFLSVDGLPAPQGGLGFSFLLLDL